MAAAPARARPDYDFVIKLLLIGDSGVGKSCLLLRFSDGAFNGNFITTIGIDFKIRSAELDGKKIKLQIWDTAGQERFRTITNGMHRNSCYNLRRPLTALAAYYRGAMGILLVYYVTDESSFNNIRNWIRNIEQQASDKVNKILVGNKADMDESRRKFANEGFAVIELSKESRLYLRLKALAEEYGIKFFEASAMTSLNVEQAFLSIARDVMQRLAETATRVEDKTISITNLNQVTGEGQSQARGNCCGS